MKVFGTVYPFVESGDVTLRLGRHVANYEFLKALLRRGGFDEYHLFCLSTGHLRTTMNRLRSEDIPNEHKSKVRLLLIHDLLENLESRRYHPSTASKPRIMDSRSAPRRCCPSTR